VSLFTGLEPHLNPIFGVQLCEFHISISESHFLTQRNFCIPLQAYMLTWVTEHWKMYRRLSETRHLSTFTHPHLNPVFWNLLRPRSWLSSLSLLTGLHLNPVFWKLLSPEVNPVLWVCLQAHIWTQFSENFSDPGANPVSETLWFLVCGIPDDGQSPET
jgi:hypothetical protein